MSTTTPNCIYGSTLHLRGLEVSAKNDGRTRLTTAESSTFGDCGTADTAVDYLRGPEANVSSSADF